LVIFSATTINHKKENLQEDKHQEKQALPLERNEGKIERKKNDPF
jgi:hypothetical protein